MINTKYCHLSAESLKSVLGQIVFFALIVLSSFLTSKVQLRETIILTCFWKNKQNYAHRLRACFFPKWTKHFIFTLMTSAADITHMKPAHGINKGTCRLCCDITKWLCQAEKGVKCILQGQCWCLLQMFNSQSYQVKVTQSGQTWALMFLCQVLYKVQ